MTSLGDRMKSYYENISRIYLTRRTPVILRIDGKAFHTLTKRLKLKRPFDEGFIASINDTMVKLCENIQGAKLGYCQSDEISILITDYDRLETSAWFDYNVQKMVSVAASMAAAFFNRSAIESDSELYAFFDARVFNIPREEVANYFLWRQEDCTKNSMASLAQSHFSHKELQGKKFSDMDDMLVAKGIHWAELPSHISCGRCCTKHQVQIDDGVVRNRWVYPKETPTFNHKFFEGIV